MRKPATPSKSAAPVDFLGVSPYKPGHVRSARVRASGEGVSVRHPKNTLIKKGRTPR
jgi:hypothetical protein